MATHKRIMVITPSRFQWHKFKDEFHFYTMLGAIPLGLIIIYANVFIGPAELAEIPEDYEPKNWEYYKVYQLNLTFQLLLDIIEMMAV